MPPLKKKNQQTNKQYGRHCLFFFLLYAPAYARIRSSPQGRRTSMVYNNNENITYKRVQSVVCILKTTTRPALFVYRQEESYVCVSYTI